jgi:alkaline phosphatase
MAGKVYFCLVLLILFTGLCGCEKNSIPVKSAPQNIILMIGDGMGLADISAAEYVSLTPLNVSRCTIEGLQKTSSADNLITDSGASATAMATGVKTNNGSIGVDQSGRSTETILEYAEKLGMSTGIVCTSAVTHATPASFYAHQLSRSSYEEIAYDLLGIDIDVIIGGGLDNFSKRIDQLNLVDSLIKRKYAVLYSLDQFTSPVPAKVAVFTAAFHNPYRLGGRGEMLPVATGKALEILKKNEKGFFLMIEGSEIDFAAHANYADTLIDETIDFDKAAGVALDFAANDKNTLVIITADHETGGVTIVGGNVENHSVQLKFSTTGHTGIMVPVYAYGPGSEQFGGIYENTDIFKKMFSFLGR